MYVVAIAWLYVALMMSIAQPSALRGIFTFLGVGLLPLALFLWIVGTPQRRRNRVREETRRRLQAGTPPARSVDPDE